MKETEIFFAKLQEFLDEHAEEYESIDDAVEDYVKIYNEQL